jgi:hypothetical protein
MVEMAKHGTLEQPGLACGGAQQQGRRRVSCLSLLADFASLSQFAIAQRKAVAAAAIHCFDIQFQAPGVGGIALGMPLGSSYFLNTLKGIWFPALCLFPTIRT